MQKVHLLLGDIAVIATEGDEWCLGGQNYTTVIFSTKIHTQKETRAGDQKPKINLEWHYNVITLHFSCRIDGLLMLVLKPCTQSWVANDNKLCIA